MKRKVATDYSETWSTLGVCVLCVAITLAILFGLKHSNDRCRDAGGVMLRSAEGYTCVRASVIR